MREIKFRAWYNYSMLPWEWLDTSLNCVWTAINAQQYDNPEPVLMQYTGLKDKNGKEIYEGDIVVIDALVPIEDLFTTEVKWNTGSFTANKGNLYRTLAHWAQEGIKVIGNIYENPELLEGVS